jgi:hypothetical protein
MAPLPRHSKPWSDNYGNYQHTDGSTMCWVPAFYYRIGHAANPTYSEYGVNSVHVMPLSAFADPAIAAAMGYALHRAFYDGGAAKDGVFVDKYGCSNNGGIASSIRYGNPLSTHPDHNPLSGLTGAPANNYYGVIAAAKTRGADFFPASLFIYKALALLSLAHAQAATSTVNCAWYDAAGVTNYPKGNNNNALGDVNDGTLTFISDGYPNCAQAGSANVLAKTTHNGQACGVADINGNMWGVALGLTSDGVNYYIMKTSVRMTDVTDGTSLATDAWGAAGIAAQYDDLGATYGALQASGTVKRFGLAAQVLSSATSGNDWAAAGAGIPQDADASGTNEFGIDGLWDYRPNTMCPIAGGHWGYGSGAGPWALYLAGTRGSSNYSVGLRAALYL